MPCSISGPRAVGRPDLKKAQFNRARGVGQAARLFCMVSVMLFPMRTKFATKFLREVLTPIARTLASVGTTLSPTPAILTRVGATSGIVSGRGEFIDGGMSTTYTLATA